MHNNIRERIQTRVFEHVQSTEPESLKRYYVQRAIGWLLIVCGLLLTFVSLSFFAQNASTSIQFFDVIGTNVAGLIWMWLPEIFAASIIGLATGYGGYSLLQLPQRTLSLGVSSLGFLSLMIVFIAAPSSNVFANNTVYDTVISYPYRSSLRDSYIENHLDKENEYFGVVSDTNCLNASIEIDHGGVKRSFKDTNNILCPNIETNDLVWIKFDDNTDIIEADIL